MSTVLLTHGGDLDLEDSKQHLRFAFDCPPGVGALRVTFGFEVWKVGSLLNMINLSLYDPQGFRGAGHRHGQQHQVVLGELGATPGYMAGPLPPGRWEVVVHTHMVLCPTAYTLEVEALERYPLPAPPLTVLPPRPPSAGPWLKGDFHCHSVHSDARWTTLELAQAAQAEGLDFVALTDHNTRSGTAELQAQAPGLVVLQGEELTTYYGHALVLGLGRMTDWTGLRPHSGVGQLATQVAQAGGVLVVAHPLAVGDPVCTGCTWTYFDYRPEQASHFEVWNSQWSGRSNNESALGLWYHFLAQGRRIVAAAGTDAHGMSYHPEHGFTFVRAERDPKSILSALKAGRSYLSRGLRLGLRLWSAQGEVHIGDTLTPQPLEAHLQAAELAAPLELISVVDGQRTTRRWSGEPLKFEVRPSSWWNLELRRAQDGMLELLTNPVWVERSL